MRPVPVVQIDTKIGGHTIKSFSIYDPIANAPTDDLRNTRLEGRGGAVRFPSIADIWS
jgi:hypothetical protein